MVRIYELTADLPAGAAYCLATQYLIKGGFVPGMVWVFETDDHHLENLKSFIDHFFKIIGTNLYLKEVPQNSALFPQEAARVFGAVELVVA